MLCHKFPFSRFTKANCQIHLLNQFVLLISLLIVKHCPWDKSIHFQKNYMKISKDLMHIKILNNFSVVNLDFCLIYHLAMNLSTGFPFLFLIIYFTILFTTPASWYPKYIFIFLLRPYLPFLQFYFRTKCHLKKFCCDIFTAYSHQIVLSIFL